MTVIALSSCAEGDLESAGKGCPTCGLKASSQTCGTHWIPQNSHGPLNCIALAAGGTRSVHAQYGYATVPPRAGMRVRPQPSMPLSHALQPVLPGKTFFRL